MFGIRHNVDHLTALKFVKMNAHLLVIVIAVNCVECSASVNVKALMPQTKDTFVIKA